MGKKEHKKIGKFEVPDLRNASQTLLANIRFASIDERVKTLAITSSTMNEGKSTVSSNLALAIARSGQKVLIVEADMRRRCLSYMLDQHPLSGIYSVLSGEKTLDDAIVPTRYDNLYFMDAEPNIPSPPDLFSTKRFAALVDKLREMYDFVIFDTPPLSAFVDGAIISNLVDGTILVVRERKTKRDTLANSIQQLRKANARILGVVMTFTRETDAGYYYAYYNEQGVRVNKDDAKAAAPKTSYNLADEDISTWAHRTGVESSRESRGAREARGAAREGARGQRETQNGSSARPQTNNPRFNAGNTPGAVPNSNPYTPGAFKPIKPGKQPSHKSKRI